MQEINTGLTYNMFIYKCHVNETCHRKYSLREMSELELSLAAALRRESSATAPFMTLASCGVTLIDTMTVGELCSRYMQQLPSGQDIAAGQELYVIVKHSTASNWWQLPMVTCGGGCVDLGCVGCCGCCAM